MSVEREHALGASALGERTNVARYARKRREKGNDGKGAASADARVVACAVERKGAVTRDGDGVSSGGGVTAESEARKRGEAIAREAAAETRARTFVFKSRNKLQRCATAEREHRARLAKLAESRAFFDDLDEASLAEESEDESPRRRGEHLANPVELSPEGLIDALQGLGLVHDAPRLREKIASTMRRESIAEPPRATTLPRGRESAFNRTSEWISLLPTFEPLEEGIETTSSPPRAVASEKEESIADTEEELESLKEDIERLVIDDCSPLAALLRVCDQSETAVVSMSSVVKTHVKSGVKKIGEGTYGEAYRGEDGVVMKLVPMGGEALVNGEVQMGPREIHSETAILKSLTKLRDNAENESAKNFTDGFIRLIDASVCHGPYSKRLLEAWDKYAATGESENERPDNLPANQLYIAFACDDGGTDLEHFSIRSCKEAEALLFQIVLTLSIAEEECQFEHRDLHWGNVLIKRVRTKEKRARLNGVELNVQTSGLEVTIIDFTLSRLTSQEGTFFCDLNADPELFNGPKGHCQSETYRRMKKVTKGKWNAYNPKTNALWIHYLVDVILEQKDFAVSCEEKQRLVAFRKRALDYESAGKAMFDELFTGIWTSGKKSR